MKTERVVKVYKWRCCSNLRFSLYMMPAALYIDLIHSSAISDF